MISNTTDTTLAPIIPSFRFSLAQEDGECRPSGTGTGSVFPITGITMLTSDEFSWLCQRLDLSNQAQAVLASIRSSSPSHRVGGGCKNVPARYISRKIGVVTPAESRIIAFTIVLEKYEIHTQTRGAVNSLLD